jgi:hypothetical protein
MTLFQEGNTESNNKRIFPVALKTIIINTTNTISNNKYIIFTAKYHNLSIMNIMSNCIVVNIVYITNKVSDLRRKKGYQRRV